MRVGRLVLSFVLVLATSPRLNSQQSAALPQRDAQALTILSQVFVSSGGMAALSGIQDFTASGTITYFWGGKEVSGPVTIKGRGSEQFHLEAQLPGGMHSITLSHGVGSRTETNGRTTEIPYHNAIKGAVPILPQLVVANTLAQKTSSVFYVGIEQSDGKSVHHARIEPHDWVPGKEDTVMSRLLTKEVFIDKKTNQVSRISDKTHPMQDFTRELNRDYEYENYVMMDSLLVPTLIREKIAGSRISEIHITSIVTNTGVSDADFSIH